MPFYSTTQILPVEELLPETPIDGNAVVVMPITATPITSVATVARIGGATSIARSMRFRTSIWSILLCFFAALHSR
ncbi:hypothetical protein OPT61_g4272 [Boeremia exigua]|uniref:Uncharacterized protein n=1 Tax=Boeremia exigua TaxID=749465 RepID=A0ACC2IEK6_9PLEO|nr:hypothetical protein OPT61_g4272 [Boeremia exigua]